MMESSQRRRKPWYRPRNVIQAVIVIVITVFFWGLWETAKVYNGEPRVTIDYHGEFRRLAEEAAGVEPGTGDERRRQFADILDGTAELRVSFEQSFREAGFEPRDHWDDGSLEFDRVLWGPEVPPDCERELAFIQRLRDAGILQSLADLAGQPPGMPPASGTEVLWSEALQRLDRSQSARFLARVCAARMRLALVEGDQQGVVQAFSETLTLAQTLSYQPAAISHLTAGAIRLHACAELWRVLKEARFDERTCRALLEQLDRRPLASRGLVVQAVRMGFYDTVQRTYTDDGRGDGYWLPWEAFNLVKSASPVRSVPDATPSWLEAIKARFMEESRTSLLARFDEGFQRCLAGEVNTITESGVVVTALINDEPVPEWAEDPVACELATIASLVRLDSRYESESAVTRIMLALEIHHSRHSVFPVSLDELAPAILSEVPIDRMYMTPFGYTLIRTEKGDVDYILYSFGVDCTDNGGRVHEHDPWMALRPSGSGYDCRYPEPRFTPDP